MADYLYPIISCRPLIFLTEESIPYICKNKIKP